MIVFGCESRTLNPPPEIIISEDKMERILYDLSLLNALHSARYPKQGFEVFNQEYLFKKHNLVDSVWVENQNYYAQDPKRLQLIYKRIDLRIKKALDSIDQLIENEKKAED